MSDYTAAAILDGFRNESTAGSVERVMKKLAQVKAARILRVRAAAVAFLPPGNN
jgi:hypothetical protein